MKEIFKGKRAENGSVLILTLLALVGALSIAVAVSSISIVERKMTTKSRKSVTAFQAANSGIEWAMKKLNDADPGETIAEKFGTMDSEGKISCPDELFDGDTGCEIYLLGGTNQNRTVIKTSDTPLDKVVAIRSTGKYGKNEEQVGRALEAYAMPNCGSNEVRVADFCVGKSLSNDAYDWETAVDNCQKSGKRLCTAAELVAADKSGELGAAVDAIGSEAEWSADVSSESQVIYIDSSGDIAEGDAGDSLQLQYRCCRNR